MTPKGTPTLVVVTRQTRLQGLKARFATAGQAAFQFQKGREHEIARRQDRAAAAAMASFAKSAPHAPAPSQALTPSLLDFASHAAPNMAPNRANAGPNAMPPAAARAVAAAVQAAAAPDDLDEMAAFTEYEDEQQAMEGTLDLLHRELDFGFPVRFIDRDQLPTFTFWECPAVVVVGQDGLVANVAKYVGDIPIVGVNPDPRRIDGVLLPFRPEQARDAVQGVLQGRAQTREVTLAQASLNDGQRLLAFNDLFIGCASHASARYTLRAGGRSEAQSSSGVIVSTGAGSTGWLSSLFHMVAGFCAWRGGGAPDPLRFDAATPQLVWAVREPFLSRNTGVNLVAGALGPGDELVLESLMPSNGVIFSDGVEADRLEFHSGVIARVSVAPERAKLVSGWV